MSKCSRCFGGPVTCICINKPKETNNMQKFEFDGSATTNDGVVVPVKITVDYPDNQGLIAWQFLQHTVENGFNEVVHGLIRNGDLSLLEKMQEKGMVPDEAEDELGDDD